MRENEIVWISVEAARQGYRKMLIRLGKRPYSQKTLEIQRLSNEKGIRCLQCVDWVEASEVIQSWLESETNG